MRCRRGGTFVILVRQPPSESNFLVGTASTIDDGFGFVIEVVVFESVTIGVDTCCVHEHPRMSGCEYWCWCVPVCWCADVPKCWCAVWIYVVWFVCWCVAVYAFWCCVAVLCNMWLCT